MSPTTEPTSVLPPAKPATRVAVEAAPLPADVLETAPSPLDGVNVEAAALSAGDADDLIARMADEQINQLLAADEDGDTSPPPVAPPPPAVASPPPPAATPPVDPPPFVERRQQPIATAPPASFPASFSPPTARPAASDVAPTIDATLASEAPPVETFSTTPLAAPPEPADVHEALRSDAAAVAAELADDLSRSPARAAAPVAASHVRMATVDASPSTIGRAVHAIGVVPTAIVDVINLPVRAANDAIREAIGAVAIVTLANAAALLLYLMIFR